MAKKRVDKGVPGMELLVCRNPMAAKRYDIEERLDWHNGARVVCSVGPSAGGQRVVICAGDQ